MQVAQILAQNILGQAASAPDVAEEQEQDSEDQSAEPEEYEGMENMEQEQEAPEEIPAAEMQQTDLDGLLSTDDQQSIM